MKIKYKLLNNYTGVLITRQPIIKERNYNNTLTVSFDKCPINATTIFEFENGKASFYRKLENGSCTIPLKDISGSVAVTVAILDGSSSTERWACDSLCVQKKDNVTVVSPGDMIVSDEVLKLKLELHSVRESIKLLNIAQESIFAQINKMIEGYDVT